MSKFAPMTANLLARKGDAMPSAVLPPKQPFAWAAREEIASPPPAAPPMPQAVHEHFVYTPQDSRPAPEFKPAHDHERPRRLFVALSQAEHERLAIAAVKKDVSQHQIVHQALDAYFEKFATEMQCQCVAGGSCARGCGAN